MSIGASSLRYGPPSPSGEHDEELWNDVEVGPFDDSTAGLTPQSKEEKAESCWQSQLPCIIVGTLNAAAIVTAGVLVYVSVQDLIEESANLQTWGDRTVMQIFTEANYTRDGFVDQINATAIGLLDRLIPAVRDAVSAGMTDAWADIGG